MLAAGFYKFIKFLEYETANPDQDTDHVDHEPKEPRDSINYAQPRHSGSSHTYGDFADRTARPSQAPRAASRVVASPAMGTADDAYAGLERGGMHGGQGQHSSHLSDSPAMIISDGMVNSTATRQGLARRKTDRMDG